MKLNYWYLCKRRKRCKTENARKQLIRFPAESMRLPFRYGCGGNGSPPSHVVSLSCKSACNVGVRRENVASAVDVCLLTGSRRQPFYLLCPYGGHGCREAGLRPEACMCTCCGTCAQDRMEAVLFSDIRENCAPQMGRCGNESPELVSGMRRLMNHPVKINSANLKLMPME